jgi:hypothetical protein
MRWLFIIYCGLLPVFILAILASWRLVRKKKPRCDDYNARHNAANCFISWSELTSPLAERGRLRSFARERILAIVRFQMAR